MNVYSARRSVTGAFYEQYKYELRKALWRRFLSKHTPAVAERLARLNPDPPDEGAYIRGLRPNKKLLPFHYDLVSLNDYRKKWGDNAAPLAVQKIGRHPYVTRVEYLNGPPNYP